MLSYQHGYHAGNFADVIKHIALTRLLSYMTQKDTPLLYLETHSGKGLYDLKYRQAEKTGEYKQGVKLIWPDKKTLPATFHEYIQVLKQLNHTNELNMYPGSPYLAINGLRTQDRMYFCELHPTEFEALSQIPRMHKKVHFSKSDGVAALNAVLPPPEKRGLIFIDPSFEVKDDYRDIPAAIKQAYNRFATGVYCLWYPVVNQRLTQQLIRRMQAINTKNAVRVEFNLTKSSMEGMSGTGLWVINPPYTFAEEMQSVLKTLKTYFNPGVSTYLIESY
ncbi:MAG: 23S rRNA (adenine(2030)-N(6))-methyltransferase RlmJ [Legionella sp.]|uniref:23S rRNA (adenine(2030)-N(6))-methyltransferase RlmJ n=1 Tax=Legionella sp. TaxID=459 RepID=UPI0039E4D2BD